jgi:hypothetical protein
MLSPYPRVIDLDNELSLVLRDQTDVAANIVLRYQATRAIPVGVMKRDAECEHRIVDKLASSRISQSADALSLDLCLVLESLIRSKPHIGNWALLAILPGNVCSCLFQLLLRTRSICTFLVPRLGVDCGGAVIAISKCATRVNTFLNLPWNVRTQEDYCNQTQGRRVKISRVIDFLLVTAEVANDDDGTIDWGAEFLMFWA